MANVSTVLMYTGGYESGTAFGGVAGTGTALAGATALPGGVNVLNSLTGQTAYTLPNNYGIGQTVTVVVLTASTASALIFPPTATNFVYAGGQGVPGSAGGSVTVAAGASAIFTSVGSGNWVATKSA